MLELRPSCELCGTDLPPDTDQARICTFECTFCAPCATWKLFGICPNCGGEFCVRPRRPANKLAAYPPTPTETRKAHDVEVHRQVVHERLRNDDLPSQLWTVTFASGRPADATDDYDTTAEEMVALAGVQPGFSGVESARDRDGVGITNSRWTSLTAALAFRQIDSHVRAQQAGRDRYYDWYRLDVARVDRTSQHPGTARS